jgi:hypothetical protein
MNTQQAYINGFVKRASYYGYSQEQALHILKQASPETLAMSPGAMTYSQAANNPVHEVAPAPPVGVPFKTLAELDSRNRVAPQPAVKPRPVKVAPQYLNEAILQPGAKSVIR